VLKKIEIIEQLKRSLEAPTPNDVVAKQQQTYRELSRKMASLPVQNPADGFSNREHDQALYGKLS
jgi:hypothetical protein